MTTEPTNGPSAAPNTETLLEFRLRWNTRADIIVIVTPDDVDLDALHDDAEFDEETAYDRAVVMAKERLSQIEATIGGVAVYADIDGQEANEVTETDSGFHLRWNTGTDVTVTVRAEDEDAAYGQAVQMVKERLEQVSVTIGGVAVHADIDGHAAEEVEQTSAATRG